MDIWLYRAILVPNPSSAALFEIRNASLLINCFEKRKMLFGRRRVRHDSDDTVVVVIGVYTNLMYVCVIVSGTADNQVAGTMVSGAQSVALQNVADVCLTSIPCNPRARYRSFDGSCNNLQQPGWGSVNTALVRLLPAAYQDGKWHRQEGDISDYLPVFRPSHWHGDTLKKYDILHARDGSNMHLATSIPKYSVH